MCFFSHAPLPNKPNRPGINVYRQHHRGRGQGGLRRLRHRQERHHPPRPTSTRPTPRKSKVPTGTYTPHYVTVCVARNLLRPREPDTCKLPGSHLPSTRATHTQTLSTDTHVRAMMAHDSRCYHAHWPVSFYLPKSRARVTHSPTLSSCRPNHAMCHA